MPTRLLLEGPDIAVLLDRVRSEHGAGARIVSAEKVRSGGFAGFFARERFEVTVEVDVSDAASEPAPAPATGATSLLDLAAAIDAAEAAFALPAATAATLGAPPAAEPAAGPISTERADFAAVLAGIARTAGEPSSPTDVPSALPALTPPAEPELVTSPLGLARPFVPAPIAPSELGNVVRPARREEPATQPQQPAVSDTPSEQKAGRALQPEELFGGLLARLTALGLPRELAAEVELDGPDGLAGGLARAVGAALPEAPRPPAGAGEVLAVVGDGPTALEAAREIARTLRLDPATVLLAGPSTYGSVHSSRRVTGPADARRRAARLRRADVPTVVAVDAPLEDGAAGWAHEVVTELGATAVWAVVDATRKSADVAAHLDQLGRVDALVVRATAATGDPAGPLALALGRGVPTALVDGRRGDAASWAALLTQRLAGVRRPG